MFNMPVLITNLRGKDDKGFVSRLESVLVYFYSELTSRRDKLPDEYSLYPHHKMWGVYWIRFVASVGRLVGPSVSNSCPLYNSFTNGRISFKLELHIHLN